MTPPFDRADIVRTLEAVRRASPPFCSRPDPLFRTYAICLYLEGCGVLTRRRETASGIIEWAVVSGRSWP